MSVPDDASTMPEGFAVVPNWLARDPSISPVAKVVYLVLSSRTNRRGVCWPSQKSIASDSGYSVARVKVAITELRRLGVIQVVVSKGPTGRRNSYRLLMGVGS